MKIEISDDILRQTQLTEATLREELAMLLFQKYKVSFGQARKLAGMNVIAFQKLLAKHEIPLHYEVDDFEKDLQKEIK